MPTLATPAAAPAASRADPGAIVARTDFTALHPLATLGVLRLAGADVRSFMQGQLSSDLSQLTGEHAQITSCNSAQGRVQAIALLVALDDAVLMIIPRELVERLSTRLGRYILRAKVTIASADPDLICYSATTATLSGLDPALPVPAERDFAVSHGSGRVAIRMGTDRHLLLAPGGADAAATDDDHSPAWRLAEIRAGRPQVYDATYEAFVAQMLNLDLLGGISLTKGCYTGQEIIARAHYRGAVKRRMARFATTQPVPAAGSRVLADGRHAGDVVEAALADDAVELLAVISIAQFDAPLELESGQALERRDLPYALPTD
jgi:folate-binding protein YgfZ